MAQVRATDDTTDVVWAVDGFESGRSALLTEVDAGRYATGPRLSGNVHR